MSKQENKEIAELEKSLVQDEPEVTIPETEEELSEVLRESEEENTRAYFIQQADTLGLNYPRNIPTEKLKQIVGNKLRQLRSQKPSTNQVAAKQFDDMRALVRIQVHVLNPAKQSWTGEIFTVGNDVIPHMTRFIPFNAVDGIWHVERMFVEMLKNRKYQSMVEYSGSGKDPKKYGVDYSRNKLLPEFAITELPPLTEQELEDLGLNQAANGSIQED